MKTMDGELKQLNEKLYGLYDRSYNIAVEHWLPQVKPNLDSFNSLPHLIGVKKRIDKILYPEDDEAGICLNVAELYVLLNAVLFHDIGKGIDYSVKKYVEDDWKPASSSAVHAYISKITVYENWAELGIISERVARIIGDVCEFHDGAYGNQLPGSLYIDDFGCVRANILGALLILGDQLDDTFTRITPDYMKGGSSLLPIARFRSKILSTRIDPFARMACTEIDMSAFSKDDLDFISATCPEGEKTPDYGHKAWDHIFNELNRNGEDKRTKEDLYHKKTGKLIEQDKNDPDKPYDKVSTLFQIIRHTCENSLNLERIRDEMYILGVPIKKWLVEYDGYLFEIFLSASEKQEKYCLCRNSGTASKKKDAADSNTREIQYKSDMIYVTGSTYAIEPVLSVSYCKSILRAVYMIEGGILGKPYHQYREILNYIRGEESSLKKVKCAVSRLSKLLRLYHEGDTRVQLYHDDRVWMLSFTGNPPEFNKLLEFLDVTLSREVCTNG